MSIVSLVKNLLCLSLSEPVKLDYLTGQSLKSSTQSKKSNEPDTEDSLCFMRKHNAET